MVLLPVRVCCGWGRSSGYGRGEAEAEESWFDAAAGDGVSLLLILNGSTMGGSWAGL